ncbi:MAG: DUF1445 domain-containing protein, partial [Bacillota bacterium]|nr:DUF1445 domain-containing protein [Bacillota bacterium]
RHITNKANDPTYVTSVPCIPAGPFHATMAASMRPIHSSLVPKAVTVTAKYIYAHGAPIHVGNPELIGIKNIMKPEYGDSPEIRPGELPVFWTCGVTPQIAAMQARLPFMMSHYSGFMFITDIPDEQLTAG